MLFSELSILARPLVRVLLRHGVACEDFVDCIRQQSLSNIAFVAGLDYREEKNLMDLDDQESISYSQQHQGAVENPTTDTLEPLVPVYIPNDSDRNLVQIFGESLGDLLSTLEHNLKSEPNARRLQMSVAHNNLPDEAIANLELVSREKSVL